MLLGPIERLRTRVSSTVGDYVCPHCSRIQRGGIGGKLELLDAMCHVMRVTHDVPLDTRNLLRIRRDDKNAIR